MIASVPIEEEIAQGSFAAFPGCMDSMRSIQGPQQGGNHRFGGVPGHAAKVLEAAYEFIKRHAMQGMAIAELKRVEQASIPLRAVRELLVNAVVHADYA